MNEIMGSREIALDMLTIPAYFKLQLLMLISYWFYFSILFTHGMNLYAYIFHV